MTSATTSQRLIIVAESKGQVVREAHEDQHTDAMKRPNAPPRAKPIVPDKTVFAGQDSITICIYPG